MTRSTISMRWTLGAAGMGLALLAAGPAQAQVGNMLTGVLASGQANGGLSSGKNPDDYYRKPAPPPGLPGARSTPDRAAPADKAATDMQPNDALFDAVNRGDMAAVREALGRGADVGAHNMLGLTPIDLSVDLGHTSITFLLLSMRRAAPDAGQARARTAAAPPAAALHVRTAPLTAVRREGQVREGRGREGAGRREAAAVPRPAPARPAAPHPSPRPQVVADDGGTPRPSAGFLGFGR
jgi:hypothetical protein